MYLVTGATGNVGCELVTELLNRGKTVRVLTSNPGKAANLWNGVEVSVGSFADKNSIGAALEGVSHLFLMNRGLPLESLQVVLEIAEIKGCKKIVFLSSGAAAFPELTLGRLHLQQEEQILASPISASIVRASAFMSNAVQWAESIRAQGVVHNPMGEGKFAPIAPSDIAKLAAHLLIVDPGGSGRFSITGPELLSVPEEIAILSEILERPLRQVQITREEAIAEIVARGFPRPMAEGVTELYELVRNSTGAEVLDTFEKALGYPPRTFAAWAKENRSRFESGRAHG